MLRAGLVLVLDLRWYSGSVARPLTRLPAYRVHSLFRRCAGFRLFLTIPNDSQRLRTHRRRPRGAYHGNHAGHGDLVERSSVDPLGDHPRVSLLDLRRLLRDHSVIAEALASRISHPASLRPVIRLTTPVVNPGTKATTPPRHPLHQPTRLRPVVRASAHRASRTALPPRRTAAS